MQEDLIKAQGRIEEQKEMPEKECSEPPAILEEITMDEMAVDGICGIY